MKTTITIEQFDNGITIVNENGDGSTTGIVSLDHNKLADIGKEIWSDVEYMMNHELGNKVRMEITYTTITEEKQ